jgi:hypothetical protein
MRPLTINDGGFAGLNEGMVQLAASCLLAAVLFPAQNAAALTVTAVTSGNGYPAHQVQWTDSTGQPRSAVMVDQSASGPGYLYQLTYQVNGSPLVCAGTGITGYPGDGFVENHNTEGSDNNSLDDSTPGTTAIVLSGSNHAIIAYSMPTYQILSVTIPTTIYWFFADGRSHPIFAISQDARTNAAAGNLGADTRSPYGSLNFDGGDGSSDIGGASYGDTLKFVTLAAPPELVTGLSGWSDTNANIIPYAMEWVSTNEVDAEMGHVATLPITVQDQGKDRDANSTLDPRNTVALDGPMIPYGATQSDGSTGADAWAFQLLDYILHPDYIGDTQGSNATVQVSYSKLAWAGNFGKAGGYNNGNGALNATQYSQHYNSGANILTGTRTNGLLEAYSVFVVLGVHSGSYTNGVVGQEVTQMENSALATLSASIGTVETSGPAGVGNASSAKITYTPAGYDPTYATWEIAAVTNTVKATLTPAANHFLDHPVFVINGYTSNQLPAGISVGAGLTTNGVNFFASVDTSGQRLWITVNRAVSNALNLVITNSGDGGGAPAPVISSISASGTLGSLVVISGQNFTGATAVAFNGIAASFTVNSTTQITATVPAAATTGLISVTTPGGTAQSQMSFTVVPAPANLPIYDGSGSLLNEFQDYSWATNVNYSNTNPVYSGLYSISITAVSYTALALYYSNLNTTPYSSLSFWINGGAAGASGLQLMGVTNQTAAGTYSLPALAANTWTPFNIPLSTLGVANITNCQGFWFWPTLSGATTFYLDSIELIGATAPALAAVSPTPHSGSFVLQLSGISGQTYWMQTSTNLVLWTSVSTNVLSSSSVNITNTVLTNSSRQFWRAVWPH